MNNDPKIFYRRYRPNKIVSCLLLASVLFIACKHSNGKGKTVKEQKDTSAHVNKLKPLVHASDTALYNLLILHMLIHDESAKPKQLTLDTALYNSLIMAMVHNKPTDKWPVKTAYPLPGAILPFHRILAYYGNYYNGKMGILGELPPDEMLAKLKGEVKHWSDADSLTPVLPALQYIVVSAQHEPGKAKKYRLRMPFTQIDKTLELAKKINAIVILDVQVGWGTVQEEIPALEPYLKLPNVHLAIDPEFSMKNKRRPGSTIGTMDASDINFASEYLAKLVKEYHIPPKVLVVHRFTKDMLTNYKRIITRPEVQIVINMDGFGFPAKKINSYKLAVVNEPVQFPGIKLFYKNDITYSDRKYIMQPDEVLKLYPRPVYIQYQ